MPGQFKIWSKILLFKQVVPSKKEKKYAFNACDLGPDQEIGIRYFLHLKSHRKEVTGQLCYLKLN